MPLAAVLVLLLFALTLFVSATLLFLVQPMVGQLLLPMLGGTPAVWNTCMVFFQALLLAGYAYAHATTAWLGVRRQAVLHLVVVLLPFLTLSLTIDRGLLDYGEGSPIPGLLLVLVISVGLPFSVVSTSAPLLQKWFAGTGHPAAKDPYFLYGASNLGSMLALFGYPTLVQPNLELAQQRLFWQIGYCLLVVLTVACAICLWRAGHQDKETGRPGDKEKAEGSLSPGLPVSLSISRRLRWVALAFVPSSLMLGATTYMTTDVAAIPLLWVLPLGLYLLSFILVFSRLPAVVHRVFVALLPLVVLALTFLMMAELPLRIWWKILVHLAVLFVAAMVCHGELARDRPPTRYLTGFYLWMSIGGVLGGLFNALVAPVIFHGIVEYPLALVLACLLTPALEEEKQTRFGPVPGALLMGLFLGAGVALLAAGLGRSDLAFKHLAGSDGLWLVAGVVAAGLLVLAAVRRERGERTALWLDLGLPVALGVLAIGLNLGLRIVTVHRGLDLLFAHIYDTLAEHVRSRLLIVLDPTTPWPLILFVYALPVALCYLFVKRPLRFGLGVAALFLATSFCDLLDDSVLLRERSFFGVLHVSAGDGIHRLEHGTTLHGQQRMRWKRGDLAINAAGPLAAQDPLGVAVLLAAGQDAWHHPGREPQTYFHRTGPIGQIFEAYEAPLAGQHLGLIGLGSGTLATYGQPGQRLTYYEIDPLVKRVAYDPAYFTFLKDAEERGVVVDVVLGDARLKLEDRLREGPPDKFALIVVDAFSSDAIPIHLITRQAMEIYLANLAENGLLVFHISNRYLDLEPVLGNLARKFELAGFVQNDWTEEIPGKAASTWVVMARHEADLNRLVHEGRWEQWQEEQQWNASRDALLLLAAFPDASGLAQTVGAVNLMLLERLQAPWRRLRVIPAVGIWSDDYSNLLRVYNWRN